MVREEAAKNGRVPVALALAVAKVESDFKDAAFSPVGARGVMQIMPKTAMDEFGVPANRLLAPRLNIKLGIAYLERLYDLYGHSWTLALSHYNGGSLQMVGGVFVPHDFNRQYVSDVLTWAKRYQGNGGDVALAHDIGNG